MAIETTFVIFKNDCVERGLVGKVLDMILTKGFRLGSIRSIIPSKDVIARHYAPHQEKSFFPYLLERMADKMMIVAIFTGENAIKTIRNLAGDTACSENGTIRGIFGTGITGNIIHTSENEMEFTRELTVWTDAFR